MTSASFDCDDIMTWTIDNSWGQITDKFSDEELVRIREAQRIWFAWQIIINDRIEPPENPDIFHEQDVADALQVLGIEPTP